MENLSACISATRLYSNLMYGLGIVTWLCLWTLGGFFGRMGEELRRAFKEREKEDV
ncbi:MAG: hypothetical protein HFI29_15880 [Lachnospiraceae bacterium]|nr:hypothetical protein [Lachnospiraceae bacterium]